MKLQQLLALLILGASSLLLSHEGPAAAQTAREGEAFDAAPFGYPLESDEAGMAGVRWGEPRRIRRVAVEFDGAPPPADKLRLEYWHNSWTGQPDPLRFGKGDGPELTRIAGAPTGAGAGAEGWVVRDDWFQGQWKESEVEVERSGRRLVFTFRPTGAGEFKDLGQPGVPYRWTLKLRLKSHNAGAVPKVARLQALTDSSLHPLQVRVLWGIPAAPGMNITGEDHGRLEIFNGKLIGLRPAAGAAKTLIKDREWRTGIEGGVAAELMVAVDPAGATRDEAVITVRSGQRPFSFAADEVMSGQRILVDDLGVLVTRGDDTITLEGYRQRRKEFSGRTVYDGVVGEKEQTLSRAWRDMPIRRPMDYYHGLPGNRNCIQQKANGDIMIMASPWHERPRSSKDSNRKAWEGNFLTLRFGFPKEELRGGRELREGYLPLLRTWWQDGPVHYEQLTILDKVDPDLGQLDVDDPTVLLIQVRVINTSQSETGTAALRLSSSDKSPETLVISGERALGERDGKQHLRYLILTGGRGKTETQKEATRWSLELKPGESHDLLALVPSITLKEEQEIAALRLKDFDRDSQRVLAFWRAQNARGAQISTPEPWLNGFYRAHLQHMLINCLKDKGSDRLLAHVATMHYGVYANESVMMATDLDRRGYHDEAARCLETWLHYQGTAGLPGNFKTTNGVFYGANGHEAGGYNKHHGYVLWGLAEHWRYTRDRAWMAKAAPKLVLACDWIISERRATMRTNLDGSRPIEYGAMPAGWLEDVQDYWYWLAMNTATVWGFEAVADALSDYGHPEAPRLAREARAYHEDVMRGITESRVRTPVVRLRDGTYIPKYPSGLYTRGRSHGWVRETLEGALFLPAMGLVPPDAPESTWILKDYEDNLYISERYGYSIPVLDRFWFSRGGFSMQANLLDGPIPYLRRDEIKHFLRAYFNAFASAFEPGVRMLNEHSLPELGYPGGAMYKTSDEAQSTYWLRLMFIHEQGKDLYLGQAIPRYWLASGKAIGIERAATHFGPMSLRITADGDRIRAVLSPPERNAPGTIYLRLRHPHEKPIQSVTVKGKPWKRFDPKKEWVSLPGSLRGTQEVVAVY